MKNFSRQLIFAAAIIMIATFLVPSAVHADGLCVDSDDLVCPPTRQTSTARAIAGDMISLPDLPNPFQAGGDRLTDLQQNDGGWDWPLDDGDPNDPSPKNTVGPIAMGLAQAYLQTGDPDHLAALSDAGGLLLAKTNNFSPSDGYLAAQLDAIFGGTTYVDHVTANFYGPLAAGTYNRNGAGTLYDTAGYVALIRTARANQGIPNLAAWDIGMGLVGAASAGASTSEWIAGVKAEIDELEGDGTEYFDVIGLAGAVYGLAFVGEDFDPTAGEHAAASNLADLAVILAGYQLSTGGFTWTATATTPGSDETVQETAYAVLALQEFDPATHLTVIQDAIAYLRSVQLVTGGWENAAGSGENNEVTGEALWAISVISHDYIFSPRVIPQHPYQDLVADISFATSSVDDPAVPACGLGAGAETVWYSYTPAENINLYADTFGSDFDTFIAVWTGTPGSLTPVGCNNDEGGGVQSRVYVELTADTTYYFEVGRAAAGGGNLLVFSTASFADVPSDQMFYHFIEGFYDAGITGGCSLSPFSYCPANPVTRKQMAVFILRAKYGAGYTPPTATGIFSDVPDDFFKPWIEALYDEGITAGCGLSPLKYCPNNPVTRKQMAVFILRAVEGSSYTPPAATGIFTDVPDDFFKPWIEELYTRGITAGCSASPLMFCPVSPVTRGQMAVFISRGFGITPIPIP